MEKEYKYRVKDNVLYRIDIKTGEIEKYDRKDSKWKKTLTKLS